MNVRLLAPSALLDYAALYFSFRRHSSASVLFVFISHNRQFNVYFMFVPHYSKLDLTGKGIFYQLQNYCSISIHLNNIGKILYNYLLYIAA